MQCYFWGSNHVEVADAKYTPSLLPSGVHKRFDDKVVQQQQLRFWARL